jgi:subtilase family serine protease
VLISCLTAVALAWSVAPVALAASTGGELLGGAPPARRLQLVFPLKVDGAGLERFTQAVSTPGSPLYGQYESIPTLARRFGSSLATRRLVIDYLRAHGASNVRMDATGLFTDATMNAGLAERLFAAPLMGFRADDGSRYIAPTSAVHVPPVLAGAVQSVVGLDTQPLMAGPGRSRDRTLAHAAQSSALPRTGTPSGCAAGQDTGGFTPNQYLTAYDYSPLQQAGYLGQGERVALIEIDGVDTNDVATFAQCFGLPMPRLSQHLVGLSKSPAPTGESTADIDLVDAAAPDLSAIDVYEISGEPAAFLKMLTAPLQNRANRPQVISMSLGVCEGTLEQAVSGRAVGNADFVLAEEIASGITVLASSGDSGSTACYGSSGVPVDQAAVNFPASSPYVVAVGGTNLELTSANQIADQVVWNDEPAANGAGGGGFSWIFKRPQWQSPPPTSVGKLAGSSVPARAIPDVAMLADAFPGYALYCSTPDCAGAAPWRHSGGTSAATPLLAGGLALVDQYLHSRQRPQIGQLDPLFYYFGNSSDRSYIFDDVTSGSNDIGPYLPGGGGKPAGCCSAGPGYDEASGWGSVDIARLASLLVEALPDVHLHVNVSFPAHQHPVKAKRIAWNVSCSSACTIRTGVSFFIGRSLAFAASTNQPLYLSAARSVGFGIALTRKDQTKLRSALRKHRRVIAEAIGEAFNPSYTVSGVDFFSKRASRQLKITS